jgi:hypothetical protein
LANSHGQTVTDRVDTHCRAVELLLMCAATSIISSIELAEILEAMIETKQGCANLLRKKSTTTMLSPSGSDSSFTFISTSPKTMPDASQDLGLSKSPGSSSSFCLRKLLTSRFSLQSQSSFPQSEDASEVHGETSGKGSEIWPFYATGENADNRVMIQWVLLVAIAMQLPSFLNEVMEIVELHYHSFSVLVVLGVFPRAMFKNKMARNEAPSPKPNFNHSASTLSTICTLTEIENYYNNTRLSKGTEEMRSPQDIDSVDEWGHFTDFEETTDAADDTLLMSLSSSCTSLSLSSLQETKEEE